MGKLKYKKQEITVVNLIPKSKRVKKLTSNALHKKMKFFIKDFFNKRDQIHSLLWIWSHLLEKSIMENFSSCAGLKQPR